MLTVVPSDMPLSIGAAAFKTKCRCAIGVEAFLRPQRSRLAVVCAGSGRTYTSIPLSNPGVSVGIGPSTHQANTDADVDYRTPGAVGDRGPTPLTTSASPTSMQAATMGKRHVCEDYRRAPQPACVRIPRLLVFGGDVVSVTALEALHTRMRCIVENALGSPKVSNSNDDAGGQQHVSSAPVASLHGSGLKAEAARNQEAIADAVHACVRDHITVVCPALPPGMTPTEAAKKFTRQYPVVRYCIEHGLPIIPVDNPKSLTRSELLKEMLESVNMTAPSAHDHHPHRASKTAALLSYVPPRGLPSWTQRCGAATTSPSPAPSALPCTWLAQGRPLTDYDLSVVVSFRYFLPKRLLQVLPPVINMHPSLLPRYRGASPIFSALRRNETVGGVSIIQMKPEQTVMDSGNILWQCEVPIAPDMDIRLYFPLVTQIGAAGLCDLIFGKASPGWRPAVGAHNESDHPRLARSATFFSPPAPAPAWLALRQRRRTPLVHSPGDNVDVLTSTSLCDTRPPIQAPFNVAELPSLPATSIGCATASSSVDLSEGSPRTECSQVCLRPRTALYRVSTQITPETVQGASKKLRALFFQNQEKSATSAATAPAAAASAHSGGAPLRKEKVSLTTQPKKGIATTALCAKVFPESVLSPHCDWPDSFAYSWKFAQAQAYPTYKHFSEDPYHAPLLSKDAAVVRFSCMDAADAFGVWRAFVGGNFFHSSVNATLDRGSSPVRNQLVHRAVRRLLLKRTNANGAPWNVAQHHPEGKGTEPQKRQTSAMVSAGHGSAVPVGRVAGKDIELDVHSPEGLRLLTEAESILRTPCSFAHVVNPTLVPTCVCEELAGVERGELVPQASPKCADPHPKQQRRARFYHPPPAIFRSRLHSRTNGGPAYETTPPGRRCVSRDAIIENKTIDSHGAQLSLTASECKVDGVQNIFPSTPSVTGASSPAAASENEKPKPLHRRSNASRLVSTEKTEEPVEDEEASEDYVPEIIHAGPPTQHRVHIPPGTGYFPESDESYGAIKCKEGWFLWKEAHMKWANKAQPAILIRKGLAMKTGVLYVGLFSEYS